MLVLGIETATDVCAVGLTDASGDVADLALVRPRQHGARLADLIQCALRAAGAAPEALDAVAVSAGPGSYTGLRIGVSTAKGLCLATGADLIAVPTLRALASGVRAQAGPATIVPVLPSRRGEVYAAVYRVEPSGLVELRGPTALSLNDENTLLDWISRSDRIGLTGPASGALLNRLGDRAWTLDGRASGLEIARLGRQRLLDGQTEDLDAFEPAYLKPFVSGDPNARAASSTTPRRS